MATAQANQKVFVSPGVYTSETDLSFVAQSVGVTTLGLVGETIKGPAFEPVFITNYDEFQSFFGGTEPTKFVNTQIPKYEAAYIAKSYLQQSNQLFVTRILGLSGYDAGPSWSIRVTANVDPTTINQSPTGATAWSVSFIGSTSAGTVNFVSGSFPTAVESNLNTQYRLSDGSTSTYNTDITNTILTLVGNPTLSATTSIAYGSIPESDYYTLVDQYGSVVNSYNVDNLDLADNDLSSSDNDPWFYANFNNYTDNSYSGYSFDYVFDSIVTGATDSFSGTISGEYYSFTGTAYTEYNDMVVATIRSRGISLYTNSSTSENHGPVYEVSGLTNVTLLSTDQYADIDKNPYASFGISGVTKNGDNFTFETNLLASSSKFLTKVLGVDNFGKSRYEVPLFVEEVYPGSLAYAYNQGYIKGINPVLVALPDAKSENPSSIAYNGGQYQSPSTPFLVSE